MSRFRNFAQSLASGYVLLGVNVLYTLVSVPLALRYLSKPEFGLWGVTTMVAGYLALVDMGMSASVARLLIDQKDEPGGGSYGGLIKTGFLVGIIQGLLILVIGSSLSLVIGALLKVPVSLQRDFAGLMIGQCAILALTFAFRVFGHVLTAHQRFDVVNYAQSASFGLILALMWLLFAKGAGVFSLLWAQAVGAFFVIVVTGVWCKGLGLLPSKGKWGQVSWPQFKEVFAFGSDIFLFALGSQLINGSQTLLLTRFLGLETTAVWSVCIRTYTVLLQIIYRIFDYSSSALAEMIVRKEKHLLAVRFRQIVSLSASLSVAAGILFALCNDSFIEVWTRGKIGWAPRNDLLLAAWLVVCVSVHAHVGLVGQSKRFRFLRYIFFIEGLSFVILTVLLHRFIGMTGMLLISLGCSLVFSFPYGLRRTREYFNLSWGDLAEWHRAPALLGVWVLPLAIAVAWLTANASPLNRLVARAILTGFPALWMLLRFGLGAPLQAEVARRAPGWIRSLLFRCWCLPPGP